MGDVAGPKRKLDMQFISVIFRTIIGPQPEVNIQASSPPPQLDVLPLENIQHRETERVRDLRHTIHSKRLCPLNLSSSIVEGIEVTSY